MLDQIKMMNIDLTGKWKDWQFINNMLINLFKNEKHIMLGRLQKNYKL
jgi:hypothetical protein